MPEIREALAPPDERKIRWRTASPLGKTGESPIRIVLVVTEDVALEERDLEQAASYAKLAVLGIRRDRQIASCPGHQWGEEFEAVYLDGAADALCACGARRSEVPGATV